MTIYECNCLGDIRANIDLIDGEIVSLLVQRGKYVMQAAKYKKNITEVEDQARIKNIITKVRGYAKQMDFDPNTIEQIYRYLIQVYIQLEKETFTNLR